MVSNTLVRSIKTTPFRINGKIPFLDCLVISHNNRLRTTIYRKLTHIDPLLDQSSYNPTSHKTTTIRNFTRQAQLRAYNKRMSTQTTFLVKTTTTRTLLDGTLPVTLIPTLRPWSTLALLRQRLYRTSVAPLKISHVYYNLTIYVLYTNR